MTVMADTAAKQDVDQKRPPPPAAADADAGAASLQDGAPPKPGDPQPPPPADAQPQYNWAQMAEMAGQAASEAHRRVENMHRAMLYWEAAGRPHEKVGELLNAVMDSTMFTVDMLAMVRQAEMAAVRHVMAVSKEAKEGGEGGGK